MSHNNKGFIWSKISCLLYYHSLPRPHMVISTAVRYRMMFQDNSEKKDDVYIIVFIYNFVKGCD